MHGTYIDTIYHNLCIFRKNVREEERRYEIQSRGKVKEILIVLKGAKNKKRHFSNLDLLRRIQFYF